VRKRYPFEARLSPTLHDHLEAFQRSRETLRQRTVDRVSFRPKVEPVY
jgi:hypothetical protein